MPRGWEPRSHSKALLALLALRCSLSSSAARSWWLLSAREADPIRLGLPALLPLEVVLECSLPDVRVVHASLHHLGAGQALDKLCPMPAIEMLQHGGVVRNRLMVASEQSAVKLSPKASKTARGYRMTWLSACAPAVRDRGSQGHPDK